jgi:hypothetical protein
MIEGPGLMGGDGPGAAIYEANSMHFVLMPVASRLAYNELTMQLTERA